MEKRRDREAQGFLRAATSPVSVSPGLFQRPTKRSVYAMKSRACTGYC